MKLIRLYAENFGVLHQETVNCTDGLNIFCRENGAGKSTLVAFLCAMLYGLGASRKNDPAENERKKYQPWQGGPFGGSMTFSVGEKIYRAERYFSVGTSQKHDTFILYDLADNSVSDDYSENLGFELFGLDAAAFERSAYLPQRLIAGDRGTDSITARLNRALDGDEGDAGGDAYRTAAALLDRQRQYYVKHGGRGYLSELDERLAALHEQEYAALGAKAEAERYSAQAVAMQEELARLTAEKERLWEAQNAVQTRAAVLAHGQSLAEHRDAQLSSAAQKRQFLHLDDVEGIAAGRYGAEAICAAEQFVREGARLRDRLAMTEERIAHANAEQNRIAAQFTDGIPASDVLDALAHGVRMIEEIPTEGANPGVTLPPCFSEEELGRHTGQALMHAQMTEVLARPQTARDAYLEAMTAAELAEGDPLPDEDTMQAYADVLGEIASNRERQAQILPQKQEADTALAALLAQHETIPPQSEIVVMRSRFDALRGRNEEIEELEARQRLAVQVDENIRRNRRLRIGIGCGLLLIAAVLCVLYASLHDMRFLIAGAPAALAGLLLLVIGLGTRSDDSDETRALEDAAQKRLCVKKSEYETEKTQIYEFLDRIGVDAPAVIDENDAAQRFDAAAAAAREREVLSVRAEAFEKQYQQLLQEEAHLCASLTSYTKGGGGELADIGDDRTVFADYRKRIASCSRAKRLYDEEQKTRAQAKARLDALALVLEQYLQTLEESCPQTVGNGTVKCGDTQSGTYTERMTAWCRTADLLRIRIGEMQDATQRRAASEAKLKEQLARMLSPDAQIYADSGDTLTCAKAVLALCAQYQTLAAEKEACAQQRVDLGEQTVHCDAQVQQFLAGYFGDAVPEVEEGLRIIRGREAALAEDMNRLRQAQRQLGMFLSEHGMTEELLKEAIAALTDADAAAQKNEESAQRLAALDRQIREMTDRCAKARQNGEEASRIGAEVTVLRAKIRHTEQMRAEAEQALQVIRTAQACLEQAKTAMSTRYLSYMQERFRVYWGRLMHLTDTETEALSLDAVFSVQTEVLGARRDAAYFSRGTQDCMTFCVRLAMIDAMYTDGGQKTDAILPPLLLDDPFVNLDATHLSAARAMLDDLAERFQILYFVCHESRA